MKVFKALSVFHLGFVVHVRTKVNGFAPNIKASCTLHNSRFGFDQQSALTCDDINVGSNNLQNDATATIVIVGGGK